MINQFLCTNDGGPVEITNQTSGFRTPATWLTDWATGGKSDAGVAVNGYTALTHCPLWQGVNIIAGDIGCVPIRLVKDEFNDQRRHPAWNLLRVRPNDMQTPSVWKETMIQWALIWGNGVSWIRRQGNRPTDLIPLRPDCLRPEVLEFDGEQVMIYHYHSPLTGKNYSFMADDVIHIQGLTGDGIWGYPLYQVARNCIGQGLALERHGNSMFANGAVPGGVLESPVGGAINKDVEARRNLREEWNALHRGPDKAGAIAILTEGITYKQISHTNVDSQWIEAVKLSIIQAAGLLNLPPHKLGSMEDSSTRSNLEEQNADYVQRTLTRHFNRCSEEFRRKLLTVNEWLSDQFQFVWDVDTFMKADIDTLTSVVDRLVKATVINPNEGRRMLGKPPREGGEVYGSPAINPNQKGPEDGAESPDNGRPQGATTENAHRELLLDRISHLLEREGHNLNRAAVSAKLFVRWLDEFYLGRDGETPTIDTLAESITGPSIRACCAAGVDARGITAAVRSYAKTRHAQILEACSSVTKEQLPAAIDSLAANNTTLVAQGLLATALGEINGS
jgi:HK97 family phage portal protein